MPLYFEDVFNDVFGSTGVNFRKPITAPNISSNPTDQYAGLINAPDGPRTFTFPRIASTFTIFQSGHGFTASGAGSSNLNDTFDFVKGTQSAQVTTNGSGTNAYLRKLQFTPVDLTGKYVGLWVKVDDWSKVNSFQLLLSSNVGGTVTSDDFSWSLATSQTQKWLPSGEWCFITLGWANANTANGSPDRTAIQNMALRMNDNSGGTGVTYHCNGIVFINEQTSTDPYPNGVATIMFDDCRDGGMLYGKPYMDIYGFPGQAYVIDSQFGLSGYALLSQYENAVINSGWSVATHADSDPNTHTPHYTGILPSAILADLTAQKEYLAANNLFGYDDNAYPSGLFNVETVLTNGPITLPVSTITATSLGTNVPLPSSGSFYIGTGITRQTVTYGSVTNDGTTLTFSGCTGGTGTFQTGALIATPQSQVMNVIRSMFRSARVTNDDMMETLPPADPYKLRLGKYPTNGTSPNVIIAAIDVAYTNKQWFNVLFHQLLQPSHTTTLNGTQTLPASTITVASTTGFPTAGPISVGGMYITYTGTTGSTFTGCTSSDSSASVTSGTNVYQAAPSGSTNYLVPDFQMIIDHIATKGMSVATVPTILKNLKA